MSITMTKRNKIIAGSAAAVLLAGGITFGVLTAAEAAGGSTQAMPAVVVAAETDGTNGTGTTTDGADTPSQTRGNRANNRTPIDPATVAVTEEQASAAAIAAVGGGEATGAHLRAGRGEDATPNWDVRVTNGDITYRVLVDANTGVAGEPQEFTPRADSNRSGGGRDRGAGETGNRAARTPVDPASVAITEEQASAAAVTAVGGGEATRAQLRAGRGEDASPTWHVRVTNGETSYDVRVDATTGAAGEPREVTPRETRTRTRGTEETPTTEGTSL